MEQISAQKRDEEMGGPISVSECFMLDQCTFVLCVIKENIKGRQGQSLSLVNV